MDLTALRQAEEAKRAEAERRLKVIALIERFARDLDQMGQAHEVQEIAGRIWIDVFLEPRVNWTLIRSPAHLTAKAAEDYWEKVEAGEPTEPHNDAIAVAPVDACPAVDDVPPPPDAATQPDVHQPSIARAQVPAARHLNGGALWSEEEEAELLAHVYDALRANRPLADAWRAHAALHPERTFQSIKTRGSADLKDAVQAVRRRVAAELDAPPAGGPVEFASIQSAVADSPMPTAPEAPAKTDSAPAVPVTPVADGAFQVRSIDAPKAADAPLTLRQRTIQFQLVSIEDRKWPPQKDLTLLSAMFRGDGVDAAAVETGVKPEDAKARFRAIREAMDVQAIGWGIDTQRDLLTILRRSVDGLGGLAA